VNADRLLERLKSLGKRLGFQRDWYLIAIAALTGTITAFGAVGFKWLLDRGEGLGVEIQRMLSVWALPLLPMAGALLTGLLVHYGAKEARGHGIPEVMEALFRKRSVIRPRVAVVKSLASACTIGSGGSAGAEGPIVQIGAAIGSACAQALKVSADHAATLLGCGAAAGIASVFNAPIAGVFFVLEILLRDFSLRTFTPIVVASVFSTATTQALLGKNEAIFAVSKDLAQYEFSFAELPLYIALGVVCGGVAAVFSRMINKADDLFDGLKLHPVVKPVSGALAVGLLGIVFLFLSGAQHTAEIPPFFGNGYEPIRELLHPESYAGHAPVENAGHTGLGFSPTVLMLLALVMFKAVATCFTLGSGGSGGVFAPSLLIGATTGGAVGMGLEALNLIPAGGSPASYALVGMAAVLAGTTHAPLTAILILFEVTRDVYVLLPIMLAAVMSVVVAQAIQRDSVYSMKLRRLGVLVGSGADLSLLRRATARDVTPGPFIPVFPDDPLTRILELRDRYRITDFCICDKENNFLGMVVSADLRTALLEREAIPYLLVEELVRRDIPVVDPEETLDRVLEKFSRHEVNSLPVIDPVSPTGRKVTGLITRARLMNAYQTLVTGT